MAAERELLASADAAELDGKFKQTFAAIDTPAQQPRENTINAGLQVIDEVAKLEKVDMLLTRHSCPDHKEEDCPANCRVQVLLGWRSKLMSTKRQGHSSGGRGARGGGRSGGRGRAR